MKNLFFRKGKVNVKYYYFLNMMSCEYPWDENYGMWVVIYGLSVSMSRPVCMSCTYP